jgi:hypothetical protein
MRIKIIGDNNCARATRHLLRKGGFAVSEFIPVDAITAGPHFGYAITIELAPVDPDASRTALGVPPACTPESSPLGVAACGIEEASAAVSVGASSPSLSRSPGSGKGRQAEACPTSRIHFDSVDGELEAAVLRHVAQLAAGPVVVDRPGGVVRSERELRIVVPTGRDAFGNPVMDEAAAVAVEFGVLRGLLDLAFPPPLAASVNNSAPVSGSRKGSRKKWWSLSAILLAAGLSALAGSLHAAPRHVIEGRGIDGSYLHLEAALAAPAQGQFETGQINIALIGGAAVSGSLYDSGNTALKVNCVVGCSATSGFSDNAAFSAGSTAVNNISAVFNDSITALTSGNAGALRSTTDRMLYVNVGKLGGTALSGANVVDSGNTAFRVNCVVGCSASAGFTDNSSFTAGSTAESNVGGVYNDGLSSLSSGNAAAARITSARGLHINLRNSSGTEIGTSSNPVRIDPVGTTTQPVSWSGQSVSLTGSWPYSGALGTVSLTGSLPAFASTPAFNVSQWDSTALGAPSAYGTSPGAVNVPGVNAYITNSPSVGLNGGSNTIGSVKLTDGTNTVVVDPCKGQAKSYLSINQTANAQLATGTASKKIYICSIHVVVAAATNVALVEGTGTTCGTSTAGVGGFGGATAATGWNFAANGGIALGNGDSSLGAEGTAADNLCLYNSGSGQVSGGISYVVQ